ncbi:beta-lactamase/transpeptidase-like protein [Collybia nuda]|uniref:Beta-lactamase/transpeptidase-like protein n=1 Tax=Collybia nuda TaxID=64659 RepID=A0A9P5Y6V4_9AGAR|nr:beta-lactamase/transpeptidase-like protein [Collybia nuda]
MQFFQLITHFIYGTLALWQTLIQGKPNIHNVLTQETDEFIEKVIADWNSPGGIAVAFVRKDDQGRWNIETKGYGRANLGGAKITENTLFAIGSNSKLFTALAVGLLIHNETLSPRLSWNTKVASVIPSWELMDPIATKQATILDIMSHRTGLPRHDFSVKSFDNITDVIKKLKFHRPSAEFRDVWQYNNHMYTILSYLPSVSLQHVTPLERYVKEHILVPLGMYSTTYSRDGLNATGQFVEGTIRQGVNISENPFGNGTVRSIPFDWLDSWGEVGDLYSGAGGVFSTAADIAIWLQTLLLGGINPSTNRSVIPVDVIEKVSAGVTVENGKSAFPELSPTVYGGGQARGTYRGYEIIEHNGLVAGFNTLIARLPFPNLGVAVLSNDHTYGGFITEIIKYRLLDEALGLKRVDWNGRYKAGIKAPNEVKRPIDPSPPPVDFSALAGTYNNHSYGKIELCLVSNNTSLSGACQALLSKAPRVLPGGVELEIPTFLGEFNGMGMMYISISHFDGSLFNVTGLNSIATRDQAEPYWVFKYPTPSNIYAEFAVDDPDFGFGLTGIWGPGRGVLSPRGDTVRERAEVWFDKIL